MQTRTRSIEREVWTVLGILFVIEMFFWMFAAANGRIVEYGMVAIGLLPLSLIGCGLTFYFRSNKYLLLGTVLLLNIGFMVQVISREATSWKDQIKYFFAFTIAFAVAFVYLKISHWLSMDIAIPVLIGIQTVIWLGLIASLHIAGTAGGNEAQTAATAGGNEAQTAFIQMNIGNLSITPLEIVKVIYVFVTVILLCKDERREKRIARFPRELFWLLYTGGMLLAMVMVRELGTALVMILAGFILFIIFGHSRKIVGIMGISLPVAVAAGWGICVKLHLYFLGKKTEEVNLLLRGVKGLADRVYDRIMYAWHPEWHAANEGYQGVALRKALAVGGLFGPDKKIFMFDIPLQNEDMIFARLIQTCGFVMGALVILIFLVLVWQGMRIASEQKDSYYKGLAMGFTIIIAVEAAIHIMYNTGIGPITGIPLYFISGGGTALTTGLCMISLILVISTERQERSRYEEDKVERKIKKIGRTLRKRIFPGRIRVCRKAEKAD